MVFGACTTPLCESCEFGGRENILSGTAVARVTKEENPGKR
jgi:hypothetical protein